MIDVNQKTIVKAVAQAAIIQVGSNLVSGQKVMAGGFTRLATLSALGFVADIVVEQPFMASITGA